MAVEPQDFRKGIDGLSRICREVLASDPLSGTVFVFRSRRGTAIRVLSYDGQGFWLHHKRLSQGRFRYWPGVRGSTRCELLAHELQVLLAPHRLVPPVLAVSPFFVASKLWPFARSCIVVVRCPWRGRDAFLRRIILERVCDIEVG